MKSEGVDKPPQRLRLRVSPVAETQVRAGHPWVFAGSVRSVNRAGQPGELAVIYDRNNEFLAVGLFDPDSPIRVRVLQALRPVTVDAAFWRQRLATAAVRRAGIFDTDTTAYRVLNGESDGWPGLVLDQYERTLVLKIYTAAWLPHLEVISGIVQAALPPDRVVLRLSRNIQGSSTQRWSDGADLWRTPAATGGDATVIFRETGLRFEAEVVRGQKTGFFLDQRENRRLVESLARARTVLNAFSFSGGFSLYAARGGARAVTDLDISKHALESARRNFALNQAEAAIANCRHESIQADAFEWLGGNAARRFDLIVLDPPSLAKREAERAGAIRTYERLALSGLRHLNGGGVLVACSCSAHVSAEEFFGAVRHAVRQSKRGFTELQTTRHAADHPATIPEAEYLKAIYLRVD